MITPLIQPAKICDVPGATGIDSIIATEMERYPGLMSDSIASIRNNLEYYIVIDLQVPGLKGCVPVSFFCCAFMLKSVVWYVDNMLLAHTPTINCPGFSQYVNDDPAPFTTDWEYADMENEVLALRSKAMETGTCIFTHVKPRERIWPRFNFWWDVRNDFMFWGKDDEFAEKLKTYITGAKTIEVHT
jgi:hypothetical protein